MDIIELDQIRIQRTIKEQLVTDQIRLGGSRPDVFAKRSLEMFQVLNEVIEERRDLYKQEVVRLSTYTGFTQEALTSLFESSLETGFYGVYKILKSGDGDQQGLIQDRDFVKAYVESSALDFIMLLRVCERRGISPEIAAKVGEKAHWFTVGRFLSILENREYNELPEHLVLRAIYNNPRDTEDFLGGVMGRYEYLLEEFGDKLPKSAVLYAAYQNSKDSEGFLEGVIQKYEDLLMKFGDKLPRNVILHAVYKNSRNSEGFLVEAMERYEHLLKEFGDKLPKSIILHAAHNNPKDSEGFLKAFMGRYEYLLKEFEGRLPGYVIMRASYYNNPVNSRDFLDTVVKRYKFFRAKYMESILDNKIYFALAFHPANPEIYLNKLIAEEEVTESEEVEERFSADSFDEFLDR